MNINRQSIPLLILALLLVLTAGILLYLWPHSPRQVEADLALVIVSRQPEFRRHLFLSGNTFDCIGDDPNLAHCQVSLAGRLLDMQVQYNNGPGTTLLGCQAVYNGREAACQPTYGMHNQVPIIVLEDTLGLSEAAFVGLRRTNWLDNLLENQWLLAGQIWVWLFVINIAVLLWQGVGKVTRQTAVRTATALTGAFAAYWLFSFVALGILLLQGWVD